MDADESEADTDDRLSIVSSVRDSLELHAVSGIDQAAADLALTYAAAIDAGAELHRYGPLLLAALESLGMTPRARRVGAKADNDLSPLDELRARRPRPAG